VLLAPAGIGGSHGEEVLGAGRETGNLSAIGAPEVVGTGGGCEGAEEALDEGHGPTAVQRVVLALDKDLAGFRTEVHGHVFGLDHGPVQILPGLSRGDDEGFVEPCLELSWRRW